MPINVGFDCCRLVLFMLKRSPYTNNGAPEGDLVTAGLSGLRLAAQRYDPGMGTRFSTVASMWISQGIQRSR
jgi:DNA-directed RNA polymerase sigma subunit (sigma70/sigma32)